jgi:2-phospho-L-lactate/phosphoenolpyruvate guanylyltransferase
MVPQVVIVPVKSFQMGKQRLAGVLSPGRRQALGRRLAAHVASTVAQAGLIPLIVTADAEVAEWALASGFPSLPDPGQGLDEAAGAGVRWARHSASSWLVLHADLPLLSVADVTAIARVVASGGDVIAPSSDGGTSAVAADGDFEFSFGPGSFHRHLARLHSPTIVTRSGLLLDIDSPNDLEAVRDAMPDPWPEIAL